MGKLIFFITTFALSYIIAAILVGISFFALFGHRIKTPFSRNTFFILIMIFAFLDLYAFPAIFCLDATITIRNEKIMKFFDINGPIGLGELFPPDWFDFLIWVIQALIGHYVGSRTYQKLRGKFQKVNT